MNPRSIYRVLIVDDEPIVRQAVMRALSNDGFACEAAGDGRQAMEIVRQSRFDAVITDLHMPEVNGHRLAVDLLEMANRPAVIILTGVLEPKLSNDLRARGVDEIFFKPVDFAAFAKTIAAVIERRAAANPPESPPTVTATTGPSRTTEGVDSKLTTRSAVATGTVTLDAREFTKEFIKLQAAFTSTDRKLALQSVAIFFAGLISGWLLSWVGPGAPWHR